MRNCQKLSEKLQIFTDKILTKYADKINSINIVTFRNLYQTIYRQTISYAGQFLARYTENRKLKTFLKILMHPKRCLSAMPRPFGPRWGCIIIPIPLPLLVLFLAVLLISLLLLLLPLLLLLLISLTILLAKPW